MRAPKIFCVWTALGICGVMVLGAMTWMTLGVMEAGRDRARAEQERIYAENRADLEERTRLALWRMDALGASIMLRENGFPAEQYQGSGKDGEHPEVLLRFQIYKGGSASAPRLDSDGMSKAAVSRMSQLRALLAANPLPGDDWSMLCQAVHEGQAAWDAVPKEALMEKSSNIYQRQTRMGQQLRNQNTYQQYSNTTERAQRAKAVAQAVESVNQMDKLNADPKRAPVQSLAPSIADQDALAQAGPPEVLPGDVSPLRPTWLGGELFLLRHVLWNTIVANQPVQKGTRRSVQGAWIDHQKLKEFLLKEVEDLLPVATLVPLDGKLAAEDPLAMVSFPFRLERNESPPAPGPVVNVAFGAPLWVAWIAVGFAVLTSTLLVRGIMRLSERRASFVSAVTHELRTPLTTFRLYSDMLETGAVKEEKRGDYLRVLSREADRLSHLVENVLAFSRIERGNARSSVREVPVGSLLDESHERLEARLATAGMALEMDSSCLLKVRADTTAVEHILFNLIDNAAKYAAGSEPPVVKVHARESGRFVEIVVCDHGPGIPVSEHGRIFRAFHKSAREAAESKPGVGLGLALSRRLAREQGGDLQCGGDGRGACFTLRLPMA